LVILLVFFYKKKRVFTEFEKKKMKKKRGVFIYNSLDQLEKLFPVSKTFSFLVKAIRRRGTQEL
jgi:hypothetical protein